MKNNTNKIKFVKIKRKKFSCKNLFLLITLLLCLILIIHDFILLLTNKSAGFTLFGLLSFIAAVVIADLIIDYFESK